jgi:putative ABC transport system permease protein
MGAVEIQKDKTKKYVFYGGLDPRKNILQEMNGLKIEQGRNLQKGEENKVVLGYNYLIEKKIFPKAIELNEKIFISGVEFRVVGFFSIMGNPQDDSNVYLTEEGVKKIYPNKTGYSMIIAKADKTQIENVVDNIEKALRKSRELEKGKEDFYVASFQELLNSYMSALNIIIGFVILIALISVLVSAINTANTMITSVLERVKEVGTMKAIGAKNSEIFAIFLFESSILGFVAGLIGIFFGFIITFVAKQILSNLGWSFLSPHYSPSLFIGCILFAVVTGAISGVAPAVNASRTNVVDALRYE